MRQIILPKLRVSDIQRATHKKTIAKSNIAKSKPYTIRRGLIVAGLVFIFVLISFNWSHDQLTTNTTALASDQNLVSVYYDGQNKTVATAATTVGEALDKMGITLQKGDVVEPSLNEPITMGVTNVNVYRAYTYQISDGDKNITVTSGYRTPKKVIEQAGIKIYPEDIVESERVDEFVQSESVGQQLVIKRATPVTVVLSGKTFEFRTHAKTVAELIEEKRLDVNASDGISVPLYSKLEPGMKIVVSHTAQRLVSEESVVAPATVNQTDETKPVGYSAVVDPGSPGKKVTSYLVTERDGVEQARSLFEEKIVVEAKPKVVVNGPAALNSNGWEQLRMCESGNNYANKRNPKYRGAYQFDFSTWNNYGGYYDPADAPPAVQDAKALATYKARGASPWPLCGRYLK